jgi:hypothetical protein
MSLIAVTAAIATDSMECTRCHRIQFIAIPSNNRAIERIYRVELLPATLGAAKRTFYCKPTWQEAEL